MTMTAITFPYLRRSSLIAGGAVALAVLAGGISPLPAQSVACMVGGEPITSLDIEQRTKLNFLTTRKQMPRQEILDELINEKVKIKEGKRFGVDPSASDVDQAYTGMSQRMRLSPDQLTKSLESQGVRPETLKARLKAEMVWGSLVRGRFKERPASRRERRCGRRPAKRRTDPDRSVRIQAAADRADRAARFGAGRDRAAARRRNPCASASRPASRPTPTSSRCRTPRSATPSSRPRPTSPARCASSLTRRRSAV